MIGPHIMIYIHVIICVSAYTCIYMPARPHRPPAGLLSFFDLSSELSPAAGELQYRLVLHGTCPLARTAMCACVAVPDASAFAAAGPAPHKPAAAAAASGHPPTEAPMPGSEAAGTAPAAATAPVSPCLIVGCDDGIHAYDVCVDDAGTQGQRAVMSAVQCISESAPEVTTDIEGAAGPSSSAPTAAGGEPGSSRLQAESSRLAAQLGKDWRNRVQLTLASTCKAQYKGKLTLACAPILEAGLILIF